LSFFTSFLLELLVYPVVYEIWRWNFGLKKRLAETGGPRIDDLADSRQTI